jgi:L-fucose isomerase
MKRKVGILTFSDGRKYVHDNLLEVNWRYQNRLCRALEAAGEVDIVSGEEIVWTP